MLPKIVLPLSVHLYRLSYSALANSIIVQAAGISLCSQVVAKILEIFAYRYFSRKYNGLLIEKNLFFLGVRTFFLLAFSSAKRHGSGGSAPPQGFISRSLQSIVAKNSFSGLFSSKMGLKNSGSCWRHEKSPQH